MGASERYCNLPAEVLRPLKISSKKTIFLFVTILIFVIYSSIFRVGKGDETVMFYGLERKFFRGSGISLTTPYVVYILVSNTKYRHFVGRVT